jgi:hypothetical protein
LDEGDESEAGSVNFFGPGRVFRSETGRAYDQPVRRIASQFALGALLGMFLAGCGGGGAEVSASDVTAARDCTLVSHCPSPDGAWAVTAPGSILISHRGSRREVSMYQSNDSCCTNVMWAKPHTLFFVDDYRVFRLDPATRKHTVIASWSDFFVSPDGRWIAGFAYVGGSVAPASTVGVLSIDGKTCLAVPHSSHESDEAVGFTRDGKSVVVKRQPFVPNNGVTSSDYKLVSYAISSLAASKDC